MSDFQASSSRQGRAFEETVCILLQIEGWGIADRNWRQPDVDVEIDIVADDPKGRRWWIECKGSWEGSRNGLTRTDTLKKAIANAYLLRQLPERHLYMIVTSHAPRSGAGMKWIDAALVDLVDELRVVGFTDRPAIPAAEGDT